jgi:hypothetical protein
VFNVVRNLTMKTNILLFLILATISCSSLGSGRCKVPQELLKEISSATQNENFSEEDFYRVNNLLFEYEASDSLISLYTCDEYKKNISTFFNSPDSNKRVLSYRLIGVAKDTNYNVELIHRINSNENSLLKTWSTTALMANKARNSSDHLFKLFSTYPDGLPVNILINMFISYDSISVKKTGWKFIDSKIRNEQILAIQTLSSFESDKKLQSKLLQFLSSWEMESKGWVISSIAQQRMADLKPILEKYLNNEDLKEVIIRALESSPSLTDNEFAKKLNH